MFQYYNQRSKFLEKSVCGTYIILCATHTLFKEFTPLVIVMEHANYQQVLLHLAMYTKNSLGSLFSYLLPTPLATCASSLANIYLFPEISPLGIVMIIH